MPDEKGERIPLERIANIEFQLKLKSLYAFLDSCHSVLGEIRRYFFAYESTADISALRKAADRLEGFCSEADSWGFEALFEVAKGIQLLLMNSENRTPSQSFNEALTRGLNMLSVLLHQCESDFQWRLAVADTLDCLSQASD